MIMNTEFVMTHLKLLFSCLFLKTYKLPAVGEILYLLEQSCKDWHDVERCYEHLEYLNVKLQELKDILLYFTTSNFLGSFSDKIEQFKDVEFPIDFMNSCNAFFEKLFDSSYTPIHNYDLDDLIQFVQYIVQCEEATTDRINEALCLLEDVTQMMSVKYEWLIPNSTDFQKVDLDTKPCDCYEYEMSGDCSCIYDC